MTAFTKSLSPMNLQVLPALLMQLPLLLLLVLLHQPRRRRGRRGRWRRLPLRRTTATDTDAYFCYCSYYDDDYCNSFSFMCSCCCYSCYCYFLLPRPVRDLCLLNYAALSSLTLALSQAALAISLRRLGRKLVMYLGDAT